MRAARLFSVVVVALVLLVPSWATASAAPADSYEAGTAAFSVTFGDATVEHRVMAVTALPNAPVRVAVPDAHRHGGYRISAPDSTVFAISSKASLVSA